MVTLLLTNVDRKKCVNIDICVGEVSGERTVKKEREKFFFRE